VTWHVFTRRAVLWGSRNSVALDIIIRRKWGVAVKGDAFVADRFHIDPSICPLKIVSKHHRVSRNLTDAPAEYPSVPSPDSYSLATVPLQYGTIPPPFPPPSARHVDIATIVYRIMQQTTGPPVVNWVQRHSEYRRSHRCRRTSPHALSSISRNRRQWWLSVLDYLLRQPIYSSRRGGLDNS